MKLKKLFMMFLLFMVSLSFGIGPVLASCSDCSPGNCEACGCVENSKGTACIYQNYDGKALKSCGGGYLDNIPSMLPKTISIIYTILQIAVPIVLVIFGMLDLFKSITAQKEEEIKKGQQMFVKRLIVAALVFLIFIIVKVVISFVADGSGAKILECTDCFISNNCD